MPCYHPIVGYRDTRVNPKTGKFPVRFAVNFHCHEAIELPCGQCIGCRLERSRQWALRCVHESKSHSENCFITLTYNDKNLPDNSSLVKGDFQKFLKRLRKYISPRKVRYFHCGEYGENTSRPHYHACLFGLDFSDKKLLKVKNEYKLYTSEVLSKLWTLGHSVIGDLTFESAAYVARYIMKKVLGKGAPGHYEKVNKSTGEIFDIQQEYSTMSLKPGIGQDFYNKYNFEIYPDDFIIISGKKMKPPKFYDIKYELENPKEMEVIKEKRKKMADEQSWNSTYDRLKVREKVRKSRISILEREIEEVI